MRLILGSMKYWKIKMLDSILVLLLEKFSSYLNLFWTNDLKLDWIKLHVIFRLPLLKNKNHYSVNILSITFPLPTISVNMSQQNGFKNMQLPLLSKNKVVILTCLLLEGSLSIMLWSKSFYFSHTPPSTLGKHWLNNTKKKR